MNLIAPFLPYIVFGVIGGLIGWITNYLAVKMLFRPRKPLHLGVCTLQGLVPKRQQDLAASIGEAVQSKLLKHDDIAAIIESPKLKERVLGTITSQIDLFLAQLTAKNPMVGMFLSGDLGNQIKEILIEKLEEAVPKALGEAVNVLEEELDFKAIVEDRIATFDLSTLEDLVYSISKKELRAIELLGGVLGAIIGVLQAAMMPLFN